VQPHVEGAQQQIRHRPQRDWMLLEDQTDFLLIACPPGRRIEA
jgi:hypothetical protein